MFNTIRHHLQEDNACPTIISIYKLAFFKPWSGQHQIIGKECLGSLKCLLGNLAPLKGNFGTKKVSQWYNNCGKILNGLNCRTYRTNLAAANYFTKIGDCCFTKLSLHDSNTPYPVIPNRMRLMKCWKVASTYRTPKRTNLTTPSHEGLKALARNLSAKVKLTDKLAAST